MSLKCCCKDFERDQASPRPVLRCAISLSLLPGIDLKRRGRPRARNWGNTPVVAGGASPHLIDALSVYFDETVYSRLIYQTQSLNAIGITTDFCEPPFITPCCVRSSFLFSTGTKTLLLIFFYCFIDCRKVVGVFCARRWLGSLVQGCKVDSDFRNVLVKPSNKAVTAE